MGIEDQPGYLAGFKDVRALRDLGGWKVIDGRRVRRGCFFRGATLADLTDEERTRVQAFGLASILDLRAQGELVGNPD